MTTDAGAGARGLVARAQPDPQGRLQLPTVPLEEDNAQGPVPAPTSRAAPAPAPKRQRKSKLSLLKRLERNIVAIFKLGRTESMAKQAHWRLNDLEGRLGSTQGQIGQIAHLGGELSGLREELAGLERAQHDQAAERQGDAMRARAEETALARSISDLTRRLDSLMLHGQDLARAPDTPTAPAEVQSEGMGAFLDSFYHRLENKYRGSVDEISNRLRIYLPDVEAAVLRTGRKPVMDLGCGRGEWLGLLAQAEIPAFGVDINPVQIAAAQEAGLDVRLGDSLEALAALEDNSLSVITAHHLVEHLPFDKVAWIAREAMRVLSPGGLLMFETPHTRNVLVGATTFHTDPTHLKPMPEQVLEVLFETAGFHPIEVRALHAHERFDEFVAKPDFNNELAFLMFGPQDLSVLGIKPTGE